jgi:hypothetical protein
LRIQKELSPAFLEDLRKEFSNIVVKGTIEQTAADPSEANDEQVKHLPRLRFRFDRRNLGRLRRMIDRINREG